MNPDTAAPTAVQSEPACCEPASRGRFWIGGEYLLWWPKDGPMPFPLVTTGNPADAVPGALGQPGTVPLFGRSGLDYGALSGMRFNIGTWLDSDEVTGIEASGFLLERGGTGFSAAGNAAGLPPLYVPIFRADIGREGAFVISDPRHPFLGGIAVGSGTRLWGAEANGLYKLAPNLAFLVGFRYLDLGESVTLSAPNLVDPVNNISENIHDQFGTRNQFYGGQLGLRGQIERGRFNLSVTGTVALGTNHELVGITGSTVESGAVHGTFPGGILTQPSNIGSQTRNDFAVLPQLQLKLGYDLVRGVRAFAGYDILYLNQVVRPGNEIDHSVNPTQVLGGALLGPARPMPLFDRSDFWAQGVSFGLLFTY